MSRAPAQVAPGVHRLGTSVVNLYLVEEAGRLTLVDAGLPSYFDDTLQAIEALGHDLHDIDAVVLTHGHAGHAGMAERLRTEAQARIFVHQADAQMVRTMRSPPREAGLARELWRPTALRFVAHFARRGLRVPRVSDVTTFSDGAALDVPGHPRTIHTPGHSYGHSALHFEDRGVLVVGDALCSRDPLTGRTGPQLMPAALGTSSETALRSLDRLETLEAEHILFGHGDPWAGGIAEAVAVARARAEVPG